jgi:hypothetical protein
MPSATQDWNSGRRKDFRMEMSGGTAPGRRRYDPAPMPASTVAFDIEVAGFPWEEVDEITRGYLLSREAEKEQREAIPERTGLYPGSGRSSRSGCGSSGRTAG